MTSNKTSIRKSILRATVAVAAVCGSFIASPAAHAATPAFAASWVDATACSGKANAITAAVRSLLCQPVNLSNYTLAWSDEFTQPLSIAYNGRGDSEWVAGYHSNLGPGGERADPTDARVYTDASGVLNLSTYRNASGLVEANMQSWSPNSLHPAPLQNFYAEIRMRGPQVNGSHGGIWFLSNDTGQGHTEMDLVEQYGPGDQFDHSSSHVWPGAAGGPAHTYTSTTIARPEGKKMDWHVYGVKADATNFTVYRDGMPISTIARLPNQQQPLYLLLSLFGQTQASAADTILVDYVRMYAPKS